MDSADEAFFAENFGVGADVVGPNDLRYDLNNDCKIDDADRTAIINAVGTCVDN